MSVVVSVIFGFILLVAVTFVIPAKGPSDTSAFIVQSIWTDAMGTKWAEFLIFVAVVAQCFCTIASTTSASRMMFAFSRDRAVPGHQLWKRVSKRDRIPVYTVWAICGLRPRSPTLSAVHRLTRKQARRIAVRAQLLDAPRPTDLLEVVERLTLLQVDPTAAIAPNADLVAWSRLGSSYRPEHLKRALEEDRTLFEFNALIRPMGDLGLYLAGAGGRRGQGRVDVWLRDNDRCRRDILRLLKRSGPLTSRDIPDTCVVPWASTGWTNDRNVTQMLEFMQARGQVAISGRVGRERLWDLPERVYPADVPISSVQEAERIRNERRLAALGIARAQARAMPMEPIHVGEAGEPAVVEGVKGEWRVDPAYLDDGFRGRTALLSPFDRLIHDRVRTEELFEFEYTLEMYKPAAKRRWGYFALPILHGDRLVGKLDAIADRKASVLRVNAIHEDVSFSRAMTTAVRKEIENLATGSSSTCPDETVRDDFVRPELGLNSDDCRAKGRSMQKITTWLWFDTEAEEAATFYTSVFPDARITDVSHYGAAAHGRREW